MSPPKPLPERPTNPPKPVTHRPMNSSKPIPMRPHRPPPHRSNVLNKV